MIKKISLSVQIAIIFIIAFIATYALLAVNIVSRLDTIFETNVFDQLESAAKELATAESIQSLNANPMFAYVSYSSQTNVYSASENIELFLDLKNTQLLINKAVVQPKNISRYKNIISEKAIYYVILNYDSFFGPQNNDVFIVVTDGTLKRNMVKETAIQIMIACFLAFLLGYLLIYLWINRLIADMKKIASSLNDMDKNHYKTQIRTKRQDEIGELVENIEHMRAKIIDSEQDKQEIIQGVSHDLKTPIAIIRSYAEALDDGIYTPEEVSKITLAQCDRLNSKVKKLLAITRLGYIDINHVAFEDINMNQLIVDTAELYKTKFPIKTDIIDESVIFIGNKDSWQIVLENLLDNAIRYAKSKIIITLTEEKLTVYNDGSNISDDKIATLFNAYEKGEKGNYGLGLSIVKRTVNLFGYDIEALNYKNGIIFSITKKLSNQ